MGVGHFPETIIFIYFGRLIQDFSRSVNSFELSRIFPDTLYHNGSDGESLRSVAFLWLEKIGSRGRHMGTHLGPDAKSHDFHDFGSSPARFKEDFPLRATLPRNVKIDS